METVYTPISGPQNIPGEIEGCLGLMILHPVNPKHASYTCHLNEGRSSVSVK